MEYYFYFLNKAKKLLNLLFMPLRRVLIGLYNYNFFQLKVIRSILFLKISFLDYFLKRSFGNFFIEFELSNICNARCIFCTYPEMIKTDKKFQTMSKDVFHDALKLVSNSKYSLISFTPTTGDVLTNENWDSYIEEALQLNNIKQIIFYSNGILMNEKNQEKLISLLKKDRKKKIFSLLFSVGGLDEKTYEFMFKVNKFNEVVHNLNSLQERLKKEKLIVAVYIEFRVPDLINVDASKVKSIFNQSNYKFSYYTILTRYISNTSYVKQKELTYLPDPVNVNRACSYLYKTRFAANGDIWADGCVVSELPNEDSLKIGTVKNSWTELERKRSEIIERWNNGGIIPIPCQGCSNYRIN